MANCDYPSDFQERLQSCRAALLGQIGAAPEVYLHLGGAFTGCAARLFDAEPQRLSLHELCPELPQAPTADGVVPELLWGTCGGAPVLALAGERRLVEGVPIWAALFPTFLAAASGIADHIFIDTGMSLHPDLKTGHWALLTDFISDYADSPLSGLHRMLPRPYPDLAQAFSQHQNSELVNGLAQFGASPMLCTATGVPGYHLIPPAEARRHRGDGTDLVVHELVLHLMLATAWGCRTSALVLAAVQLLPTRPPRELAWKDLQETADFCTPQLLAGLRAALTALHETRHGGIPVNQLPEADADQLIHQNIRKAASGRPSPLKALLKKST